MHTPSLLLDYRMTGRMGALFLPLTLRSLHSIYPLVLSLLSAHNALVPSISGSRCASLPPPPVRAAFFRAFSSRGPAFNLLPVIERMSGIGKHVPYAINMNTEHGGGEEAEDWGVTTGEERDVV